VVHADANEGQTIGGNLEGQFNQGYAAPAAIAE
jgi:hypothetical protein